MKKENNKIKIKVMIENTGETFLKSMTNNQLRKLQCGKVYTLKGEVELPPPFDGNIVNADEFTFGKRVQYCQYHGGIFRFRLWL